MEDIRIEGSFQSPKDGEQDDDDVESLLNAADEAPAFGLNGRNLILQAAQQAAKKRKRSHSASQNSECSKIATRVTSSDASNAAHAQQVTQSAQVTDPEGEARANERIDSQANSGTAQPLKKHGTAASSAAPRRGATPSTAAPDALIDGLDPRDQPLVAYINRSSVPRILRQGVAKRLAGQQLARLLTDAGLPVTVAAARSTEAAPLRKYAAQAALAQEMSIYRKGSGKQVYMNHAARQQGCPSFLPSEAKAAQQGGAADTAGHASKPLPSVAGKGPGKTGADISGLGAAAEHSAAHPLQKGTAQHMAHAQGSPAKHEDLNLAGAISYQEELPKPLQLVEAEIDWAGDTSVRPQEHGRPNGSLATEIDPGSCSDDSGGEYDPRDPSLQQQSRRDADGSMAAKVDFGARSDSNSGEEYDPEGAALEIDTDDFSPRRHASGRGQRGHAQSAGPQKRSQEHGPVQGSSDGGASPGDATSMVENATLRFVKAIVNPLYAAQVISRAVYKFVLLKVTTKVMQSHRNEANAGFLVAESGQIQRLVQDYIRHCETHGIKN